MRTLVIEPLTKEAFAPFGDVIETDGSDHFMINNGSTMRFHKLATVETAQPRTPPSSASSAPTRRTCR
ncbi:ureidoglycolate lyase [Pseudomonas qingdaonensis]|nr:ureidoglycolate lyase [Pseudomonas qingdaonensis]